MVSEIAKPLTSMAAEQVDTIVGAQVELKGSLRNQGSIHIHGKVSGDIHSDAAVIVGETAIVTGPISAKIVEIAGQVHGSVAADEQIELQPKSLVKGDLTTRRLSIRPGAIFVGQSIMPLDEQAEAEPSEKKKPRLEVE
jgi:cytoskeletal protein CcmA (bactofilin family)